MPILHHFQDISIQLVWIYWDNTSRWVEQQSSKSLCGGFYTWTTDNVDAYVDRSKF